MSAKIIGASSELSRAVGDQLQSQLGLSEPSQHWAELPLQPQTPPWCEQHPRLSAARPKELETAPALKPIAKPKAITVNSRLICRSFRSTLRLLRIRKPRSRP
jgi:hypothetical protein